MQTTSVVKVDIVGDRDNGLLFGLEHCVVYEFDLQRMEEAFGNGVVVAVASGTHVLDHAVMLQLPFETVRSVFAILPLKN